MKVQRVEVNELDIKRIFINFAITRMIILVSFSNIAVNLSFRISGHIEDRRGAIHFEMQNEETRCVLSRRNVFTELISSDVF